jgi:hypothetical protein
VARAREERAEIAADRARAHEQDFLAHLCLPGRCP